ncbi:diguanylate cyclase [Caldicoprobacter algeriensis]|uniref:GGDEF domain-containing response regulator n=1 Tax=Caldicoprobacter algeriensis TaxID=699281 RepID=UPI002079FBBD|nr:diguanylate cyclase [Caldicoprobacter algeriensis]
MNEKKKILLVEDSRLTAAMVGDFLVKNGFEVEVVPTGEEVVQRIGKGMIPDLILMDIELAGKMDGIETADIISKQQDVPIVFLTANTSKEVIEKIKKVKAYGFVLKDTDRVALLSTIDMAIRLHEASVYATMFERLFETSVNELYIFDPDSFKLVVVNETARSNLGYSSFELEKMTIFDINPQFEAESLRDIIKGLKVGKQERVVFNTLHRRKDGSFYYVESHMQLFEYRRAKYCMVFSIDVTEKKKVEDELDESKKQYVELAQEAPIGILKCDVAGNIVYVNKKALDILGSPGEQETRCINLLTFPLLVEAGLSQKLKESIENNVPQTFEKFYKSKWGKGVWLRIHVKPLLNKEGMVKGAQIIMDDITEKKEMERQLYEMSITDPLTGAYNFRYFNKRLEDEILRARRYGERFALIMFDVDYFKSFNDTFGHQTGDLVLKAAVDMVKGRIRKTDVLARWGGEEFIILLPNTKLEDAVKLAEELRQRLMQLKIGEVDSVTASFGVVEYQEGDTLDSIVKRVDDMMYKAKNEGRNCVRY